jgi:predicted porin
MKKLLLLTTALVSVTASVALADAPTISVGGLLDFQGAGKSQKKVPALTSNNVNTATNMTNNNRRVGFSTEALAHIKAEGKTDNGLGYGAVVVLKTETNRAKNYEAMDKSYLFLESGLGKVELGSNYSAAKTMKVDATSVARATGGIDGDSVEYALNERQYLPSGNNTADAQKLSSKVYFLTSPNHFEEVVTKADTSYHESFRKITYITPMWEGFQAGVSYTPDTANTGSRVATDNLSGAHALGDVKNLVSGGISYSNQFDQIGFSASATGEHGNANNVGQTSANQKKGLKTYAFGASLSYANFTLAGSYGNWGKSLLKKFPTAGQPRYKNSNYYTAGLSYIQGPIGASVTYFESKYQKNKFQNVSVGADYKLAPGLMPYAEVSFIEMKAADATLATRKNKATVYILGTMLKF